MATSELFYLFSMLIRTSTLSKMSPFHLRQLPQQSTNLADNLLNSIKRIVHSQPRTRASYDHQLLLLVRLSLALLIQSLW